MPDELFDRAAEYEAMLSRGIGLSQENQDFFISGRVQDMRSQLTAEPRRVLDFGCGTGKACAYMASVYPAASIVGADLSVSAIDYARKRFGSKRMTFVDIADLRHQEPFDLCYVNGVFHHILPADRHQALVTIRRLLAPGGQLAFFENNPWNPGTRMVMRRIPFDRDAIPLSFLDARRSIKAAGFEVCGTRFLFYLPRALAALRFIEPWLVRVPMGAQYYVLARVGEKQLPKSVNTLPPQV